MTLDLVNDLPDPSAFKALYDTTGWEPSTRDPAFYRSSLEGSWASRSAFSDGQLVGFGRVISDGRLHAFITEMIVRPDFQGQGVGKAILESLVSHCLAQGLTDIQLFCAQGKVGFYETNGFLRRPEGAPGMQFKLPD